MDVTLLDEEREAKRLKDIKYMWFVFFFVFFFLGGKMGIGARWKVEGGGGQ